MRFVDRSEIDTPAELADPAGEGAQELARAVDYYRSSPKKSFKFATYRISTVKNSLLQLFKGKCAYCEGLFVAGSYLDVEHYRPKGRLSDDRTHPGYWWLAADWTNLLISCELCNRPSTQRIVSLGMTAAEFDSIQPQDSGKRNWFPIQGAIRATCAADDLDLEDALLIDPTRRDPGSHLVWSVVNDISIVSPRELNGNADLRAECTIAICGLNRQPLVEDRTRVILELKAAYLSIRARIDLAFHLSGQIFDSHMATLEIDLTRFLSYASYEKPYSKCAESFIQDSMKTLLSELHLLRNRVLQSPATTA